MPLRKCTYSYDSMIMEKAPSYHPSFLLPLIFNGLTTNHDNMMEIFAKRSNFGKRFICHQNKSNTQTLSLII